MTEFTPGLSSAGGLLIGLAAALLLLGLGRIAGISGILGAVFRSAVLRRGDAFGWQWAFLIGLPIGAGLVAHGSGTASTPLVIRADAPMLVMAGLLVGFGTQLGSGCTSGHGVCGIARGSRRSIVATLVFMAGGFLTVYVARHLFGLLGGGS